MLTAYGLVGFVELGKTLGCSTTTMMSGAWPPPAPSVWYLRVSIQALFDHIAHLRMDRPALNGSQGAFHIPTLVECVCVDVDLSSAQTPIARGKGPTWTSYSSATLRARSIASGVLPQSSCSFSPIAPASTTSLIPFTPASFPFPVKPKLSGIPSVAAIMFCM